MGKTVQVGWEELKPMLGRLCGKLKNQVFQILFFTIVTVALVSCAKINLYCLLCFAFKALFTRGHAQY